MGESQRPVRGRQPDVDVVPEATTRLETTAEMLLTAVRSLDGSLPGDPDEAVATLIEQVRLLSGSELVMFTLIEPVDGRMSQRAVWVTASGDSSVELQQGDHWPWRDSACVEMLAENRTYTPDFLAEHPDHELAGRLGIRGFLSVPVLDPTGRQLTGVLCAIDTRGVAISEDSLAAIRVLTASGTGPLIRRFGRRGLQRWVEDAGRAAVDMAARVRDTEDEVGNSLGVALGWLRLVADDPHLGETAPAGVEAAVRRLEAAQEAITDTLRAVRVAALDRPDHLPVDLTAVSRAVLGVELADESGESAWIRANRSALKDFLRASAHALADELTVRDGLVGLSFIDPALLDTRALLTLDAAGGHLADHDGTLAAVWPRATPPVTP